MDLKTKPHRCAQLGRVLDYKKIQNSFRVSGLETEWANPSKDKAFVPRPAIADG